MSVGTRPWKKSLGQSEGVADFPQIIKKVLKQNCVFNKVFSTILSKYFFVEIANSKEMSDYQEISDY